MCGPVACAGHIISVDQQNISIHQFYLRMSLQKANLESIMDLPGPITVFAPITSAFDLMPEGHLAYLSTAEVRAISIYFSHTIITQYYCHTIITWLKYFMFRVTPNWWSCSETTLWCPPESVQPLFQHLPKCLMFSDFNILSSSLTTFTLLTMSIVPNIQLHQTSQTSPTSPLTLESQTSSTSLLPLILPTFPPSISSELPWTY